MFLQLCLDNCPRSDFVRVFLEALLLLLCTAWLGSQFFLSAMAQSLTLKAVCGIKKPGQKESLALTLDKSGLLKEGGFEFVLVCRLIQCEVTLCKSFLYLAVSAV